MTEDSRDRSHQCPRVVALAKGNYSARIGTSADDLKAAQSLRFQSFFPDTHADQKSLHLDQDKFDDICDHILIEDIRTQDLVCCFRLMPLTSGQGIDQSYSSQFYELSKLKAMSAPLVEMGRFCIDPNVSDPDILRIAGAATTQYVDQSGAELLFGCSSFMGTEADKYSDAFAFLKARHLAPKRWLPRIKAPNVFQFARKLRRKPDLKQAMAGMPPLLKSYLMMGGWVSDHAVIDSHMNTLHVFTGLEVKSIPSSRKRLLRNLVATG